MLRFTIADYTLTNIPLIRLKDINEQMPGSLREAWYHYMKAKELFPLPEGRMAAYATDLEEFLNAHSREYQLLETTNENFHSEQQKALIQSYENWRQKHQEPDARPAAGASDIELEVYLEQARKREYAAIERLSIAYNNAQANARLAGFKITPKHIEVLDKFTANEISVLEAYELLDIDLSTIPDTERERLSKLYVRDIYEEHLRRKNSAGD